jgi:uncharacterized protein YPO0396
VESTDGYRELHKRLVEDDLPRFTAQFKTYLNQNTIRDIAGFHSQLTKQFELIRDRIATINASLVDVDYNPGRYIRLQPLVSPHVDIRDFRADLLACTADTVSGDDSDQYSEQKFLQVSRIIERFRGREGMTEASGRGSDESTRSALELLGRLGLQLPIVTPLQKIPVIEPYVSAIGFVDNPNSQSSRVHTLTIEEFHQLRAEHELISQPAGAGH